LIQYDVSDPSGITDLELGFNGAPTGTGLASVAEGFCLSATSVVGCSAGNSGSINVSNPSSSKPPAQFNNSISFGAVTLIAVSKDINVTSGINGTAAISQVTNQFSQSVPEPLPFMMLGSGLVGLGLLRRRVYRR